MNAIAAETGLAYRTVAAALRRHGLARTAHAPGRHAALGAGTVADYVARRRAAGWTWAAMAAETGQPASWLRPQARDCLPAAG